MKNMEIKNFLRRPGFAVLCVGLLAVPVVYLIWLGWGYTFSGIETLSWISGYWYYLCAALTVASFFSLSSSHFEDVDETISSYKGTGYYQTTGLLRLLPIFVLSQIVIYIGVIITSILCDGTDGSAYFLSVLPKMFLFNLLLPMAICLLIAYNCSMLSNQHLAAIIMLVFLVMTSPLTELLLSQEEGSNVIGYAIRHSFGIFYEESTWTYSLQAGLQTETTRLAVQLFWIFLCFAAACLIKRRKICISGCVLLTFGIECIIYAQLPASTFRHYNAQKDFYLYKDEATSLQETDENYTISDYDLTLTFGRQLDVTGTLFLEAEEPTDKFQLTLYRGYNIKSLESTDTIAWSVQDDLITIETETPTDCLEIHLHYAGYDTFLYSSSDGVMLPGWFPWYPMAGENQIYVNYGRWGSTYNAYNRIEQAHIRLTVDAPFAFVTNLEQTSDQTYEGNSDSITVIGGYIQGTDDPVLMNILPLDLSLSFTSEQYLKEKKDRYQELCDALEGYGLDPSLISDRRIILVSQDLSSNNGTADIAIFSDYILTTTSGLNSFSQVTKALILEKNTTALSIQVANMGFDETPEETLENWSFFLDVSNTAESSEEERILTNLIDAAAVTGAQEQLIKDIAKFLISDHTEDEEISFWEELKEQYGNT